MRFAPPVLVLLLCGTALAGCSSDDLANAVSDSAPVVKAVKSDIADSKLPTDVEGGVRTAQLERVAGKYDEAIHTLSQLMLIASDDPRVIGEYGKTLAEKGRAQDAVQFLTRATQLQPNDWTLYSALGVAYDQLGDQTEARKAYEHALSIKPGEPSVLNNYALSRMLANDPAQARQLIARAQIAGGGSDPKIARNIALVNALAPAPAPEAVLVPKAAPAQMAASAPLGAPTPLGVHALPPVAQTAANVPAQKPVTPSPQVVMQAVPFDPLAGPHKPATHAPTPLIAKKAEPASKLASKDDGKAAKPDTKIAAKPDVKADAAKPAALVAKSDAKPDAKRPVKADVKPDTKLAAKPDVKPVAPAANAKPATAPAIKPAADVKPAAKPDAKSGIPALRQTASAY